MKKEIKVLGTGCPKCKQLEAMVRETVTALGIDAEVSKVEDIVDIMSYGIMRTPGLVVDGKIVVAGRLPNQAELNEFLA
ncbi:MAG: TM0996/MTH895 family glutaredoxin-like protein [Bacteroidetes bacterium]|nr:TM0996/MTH895 family glutaredoxin-like protein [Bacteroidales bacterium]MBU1008860.1 TM0996/MTH895 family glutaredoxin-like protein [Bacteroidota bacterium]